MGSTPKSNDTPKVGHAAEPTMTNAAGRVRRAPSRLLLASQLLHELTLRPDLVSGIQLGDLITPEALRTPGQWVLRSQDLLSFHLELNGLRAQANADAPDAAPSLMVEGQGPATISLHFAPQAIAERVFFAASPIPRDQDGHLQVGTDQPPPSVPPTPVEPLAKPPIGTRIAYPSRLVFLFDQAKLQKAGVWPVPYTQAGILQACRVLTLNVAANARYQPPRRPVKRAVYRKPRKSAVSTAHAALSVADKGNLLASARRNEQLARRLGASAASVLLRRADLPYIGAAADAVAASEAMFVARAAVQPLVLPTTLSALALSTTIQSISASAAAAAKYLTVPRPRKPGDHETALELPFRLVLSPNAQARFTHSALPSSFAPTGHTALWSTRLAEAHEADTGIHQPLDEPIRAIWARGGPESDPSLFTDHWPAIPAPSGHDSDPPGFKLFRQTLDDGDRYNIAHLSGNFALSGGQHEAVDCQRLMLSSLGGWLDVRGNWAVPPGLSVEQWVHHAAQARDHYVRVIYKGYLLPFGHRVSLVKVSERFFMKDEPGNAAYVLQRMYLIVKEPVREFPETHLFKLAGSQPQFYHRAMPFPVVRLLTVVTPDIADPSGTQIASDGHPNGQSLFWPMLPGQDLPYQFQYEATDLDGKAIRFSLGGIFIDNTLANPAGGGNPMLHFEAAKDDWNTSLPSAKRPQPEAWRTANLNHQKVALAPSNKPGETASEIDTLEFGAETDGLFGKISSPFMRATVLKASVRLPSIGALTGGAGPNQLEYEGGYLALSTGFGPGEVYAKILGGQGLDFTSCGHRSGGFVQPNLAPSGLSRLKGPVSGDLSQVAAGEFHPEDFFSSLAPLLFGCIPLGGLVKEIAGDLGFKEMPNFVTEALQEGEALCTNLGQLDKLDDVIVGLVKQAAQAAITQAMQLAFNMVAKQLAVLDTNTAALEAQAQAVVAAASGVASALGSAGASLLSNPAALKTALDPLLNALQALANALFARDSLLKVPGADGLTNSMIQMVRQQIALVQERVQQAQDTLADFAKIPDVVTRAQAAFTALTKVLVTPEEWLALLKAGTLGPLLTALNTALSGFAGVLRPLKLIDGAAKSTLLSLIDGLDPVLGAVDKLLPILESLVGDEIVVRFAFNPTLAPFSLSSALSNLFVPHEPKGFVVAVEARVKKSGGAPVAKVRCALNHFDLNLLGDKDAGFIKLEFEKIEFTADSSLKTNVDVGFSGIHFIGVLSFVESLRSLIPLDGFSDPPSLTIDEHGLDAQFSVALPNLAVGVMSLTNLSLGAGFTVPFIGQPLSVRFLFCTREAPFNLTVSLFGGGGFFGICIDPHGVQKLEASFEFGAAIAIDFGVASGGVHVMAGIYFKMEPSKASLTGYFRLGGFVDVLGLISASIELYMDLTYIFEEGKCIGHATLTIEVHVLFFSTSVAISAERKFAGSSGDPSFAALMGPGDGVVITPATVYAWRDYCEAFA
jgi:hypothetical protein